jgi:hypothetical protein
MKKILFTLMVLAMLVCSAQAASLRQHQVAFVDEFGDPVTTITSITVFNSGLATSPTIYSDRAGAVTVTNPITSSSSNSTYDSAAGTVRWFQRAPTYKMTVTDGTKTLTLDSRDEGDTRFPWFENYIGTAASLSVNDNQSITVGTDSDAVLSWVNASSFLQWVPAVDGVSFNIGSTTAATQFDFNVYVGGIGGGGLAINEGTGAFTWTGGVMNINASSNFATNINTGTSTGAVSIGSSTAGVITIDSTTTLTINSDGAMGITTTDASADLTVDAVAGSVQIDGGEAATDAVRVVSAGGMDISLVDDFDLALVSGSADENMSFVLSGASASSIIMSSTGTGADAFDIDTTAGGIDIDMAGGAAGEDFALTTATSIHLISSEAVADAFNLDVTGAGGGVDVDTTNGPIVLTAANAANGSITLNAATAGAAAIDLNATGTGGGLDVDTTDGPVALTAGGSANGDITITAGDDFTLAVTGTSTLAEVVYQRYVWIATGDVTLVAAQSGMVFITTASAGTQTFTLPTASAGLIFTFVDASATAADDLWITAAASDKINGGTAAKSYKNTTDAVPGTVTLFAADNENWYVIAEVGAGWANDNN